MPFLDTSGLKVVERLPGWKGRFFHGIVAIVPSNTRHSVRALTDGRVIIVDHPARPEFGWMLHGRLALWVARGDSWRVIRR